MTFVTREQSQCGCFQFDPSIVEAACADLFPLGPPASAEVRRDGGFDAVYRSRARGLVKRVDIHQCHSVGDKGKSEPCFPRNFFVLDMQMRRAMLVTQQQFDVDAGLRHGEQLHGRK